MIEKRFTTDNGSNEDVCLVDNVTGKEYESNFEDIVDLLNEQHETIQFKRKHILCLQSVIQTIDVEIQEKGMTKERFEEIKTYWYRKFNGDFE